MPGDYSFDGYIAFTLFDGYFKKMFSSLLSKTREPFWALGHVDY